MRLKNFENQLAFISEAVSQIVERIKKLMGEQEKFDKVFLKKADIEIEKFYMSKKQNLTLKDIDKLLAQQKVIIFGAVDKKLEKTTKEFKKEINKL